MTGPQTLDGVRLINEVVSQFNYASQPKHLVQTGYILNIIEGQKRLCAAILKYLHSTVDAKAIEDLHLQGKWQSISDSCDNMVYINQCLDNAQLLESLINKDIKQDITTVFREEVFAESVAQNPKTLELQAEPLHLLFELVYANKISTALKFIGDRLLSSYTDTQEKAANAKKLLGKFAFRLVYELIRRDYFNKALEVITAMGWRKTVILKGILFHSSDFRISKILKQHLSHRGKFSKLEQEALQIQQFLTHLFPVNSVNAQKQKIHSQCFPQHMKPRLLSAQNEEDGQGSLSVSVEIRDLNDLYKVQSSDFRFRRLRCDDYIAQIFEFKESNRRIIDVDDCFSRDACKLNGSPICEECAEYIVNFEDMEYLFARPQNAYLAKYCASDCSQCGYLVMHTSWLLDYLNSGEKEELKKIETKYLYPIALSVNRIKQLPLEDKDCIHSTVSFMNRNQLFLFDSIDEAKTPKEEFYHQLSQCIKEQALPQYSTLRYKIYLSKENYYKREALNIDQISLIAFNSSLFPVFPHKVVDIRGLSSGSLLELLAKLSFEQDDASQSKLEAAQFIGILEQLISLNLQNVAAELIINNPQFEIEGASGLSSQLRFMHAMLNHDMISAARHQQELYEPQSRQESALIDLAQIFISGDQLDTQKIFDISDILNLISMKLLNCKEYKEPLQIGKEQGELMSSNGEISLTDLINQIEKLNFNELEKREQIVKQSILKKEKFKGTLKYYLLQGRVEQAYFNSQLNTENIEQTVTRYALKHALNEKISAACVAVLKMSHINCSLLKIDLAAANRIIMDRLNKSFDTSEIKEILTLIKSLSVEADTLQKYPQSLKQGMQIYQEVVDLFLNHHSLMPSLEHETNSKYLSQIVKFLEKATWNLEDEEIQRKSIDGSQFTMQAEEQQSKSPLCDSEDRLSIQTTQAHEKKLDSPWHLVGLFCKVHNLPPSLTLLHELARKNDWIMFLYEAQQQQCPKHTVLDIIGDYFQSFSIKKHMATVFKEQIKKIPQILVDNDGKDTFVVINDEIIKEAILNEQKGLLFNLHRVSKQLQKANKEKELPQYFISLALHMRKVEYLLYAILTNGGSTFSILVVMLLISFEFTDVGISKVLTQETLAEVMIRLLRVDNDQEMVTKAVKIVEAVDQGSPYLLLFKYYACITNLQFQAAKKVLEQLVENSTAQEFVGKKVLYEVLLGSLQQNQFAYRLTMSQKHLMVQICLPHQFGEDYDQRLRVLEIHSRHLLLIDAEQFKPIPDIISHYNTYRQFSAARQLVTELASVHSFTNPDLQIEGLYKLEVESLLKDLDSIDFDDFYQRQQIHIKLGSLIPEHPVVSELLFEQILSESTLTYYDTLSVVDNLKNHLTYDQEDKTLFYDLQIIRNMLVYNAVDNCLKEQAFIANIYDPPIHYAQTSACQFQPVPNINALLQKERCQENQDFLEGVVITLFNLNQVYLAMEICSYLQMELSIIRKVRIVCIRVDQVPLLKGIAQQQLIKDLEVNLQELAKLHSGDLEIYVSRVKCIIEISQSYPDVMGSMMAKDSSDLQQQEQLISELIGIAIKDTGVLQSVREYIRLSNIGKGTFTQAFMDILKDNLLTHANIKCILKVSKHMIDFSQLEVLSGPLQMEQRLNIICLLITYYKYDQTRVEFVEAQFNQIEDWMSEADVFPEKQLAIVTLALHKLSVSGKEQFCTQVLKLITQQLRYFEKVSLQNRHILKQILKLLFHQPSQLVIQTPMMTIFRWRLLNKINSDSNPAYDLRLFLTGLKQSACLQAEGETDRYALHMIERINDL